MSRCRLPGVLQLERLSPPPHSLPRFVAGLVGLHLLFKFELYYNKDPVTGETWEIHSTDLRPLRRHSLSDKSVPCLCWHQCMIAKFASVAESTDFVTLSRFAVFPKGCSSRLKVSSPLKSICLLDNAPAACQVIHTDDDQYICRPKVRCAGEESRLEVRSGICDPAEPPALAYIVSISLATILWLGPVPNATSFPEPETLPPQSHPLCVHTSHTGSPSAAAGKHNRDAVGWGRLVGRLPRA